MTSKPSISNLKKILDQGWRMNQLQTRETISKSYMFKDFTQAFDFMKKIAIYCDKVNHHPEWFNVYNKLDVTLSTHDSNAITDKDVDLAQKFDSEYENYNKI